MAGRKRAVIEALISIAESIAPLLIAEGVSSPEAESVLRSVCVHEAARAEKGKGNRPNASRVALLTGVDRHVVASILKTPERADPGERETRRHRLNRVLAEWHADPDYSDGGRPKDLEIRSRRRNRSFWTLSQTYAKDVYPGLILNELVNVGAVEKRPDGRVRPRMRSYKVSRFNEEGVFEIGYRVRDLTRTLLNNMSPAAWPRVCGTVQTIDADDKNLPLIRRALEERSNATLTAVDQLLNSPKWRRTDRSGRRVRIAWTCYSAEELLTEGSANEVKRTFPRGRRRRRAASSSVRKTEP